MGVDMEVCGAGSNTISVEVDTTRRFFVKVSRNKVRELVAADMEKNPLDYPVGKVTTIPRVAEMGAAGRDHQGEGAALEYLEEIVFEWTERS